jgi:hypothetical protein
LPVYIIVFAMGIPNPWDSLPIPLPKRLRE